MKSHRPAAALLIAASSLVLAACATDSQQVSQDRDPCLGVAPATGTMIVRKADCGAGRQQESFAAPAARPASMTSR
jgi:hypothetical protein